MSMASETRSRPTWELGTDPISVELGKLTVEELDLLNDPAMYMQPTEAELERLGPDFTQRVHARALQKRLGLDAIRDSARSTDADTQVVLVGMRLLSVVREVEIESLEAGVRSSGSADEGPDLRDKMRRLAEGLLDVFIAKIQRDVSGRVSTTAAAASRSEHPIG